MALADEIIDCCRVGDVAVGSCCQSKYTHINTKEDEQIY